MGGPLRLSAEADEGSRRSSCPRAGTSRAESGKQPAPRRPPWLRRPGAVCLLLLALDELPAGLSSGLMQEAATPC